MTPAVTEPRELTPEQLADAEALAARLERMTAIRIPELLRAAATLIEIVRDPRLRKAS